MPASFLFCFRISIDIGFSFVHNCFEIILMEYVMKINPVLLTKKCFGYGHYPCDFSSSPDGKVLIPVSCLDAVYALYSDDFGKTFKKIDMPEKLKSVGFKKLSDGTFMAFGFDNVAFNAVWDLDGNVIPYCMPVYRANSFEDILSGNVSTSIVSVDIPSLAAGYGDSSNRHTGCVSGWRELSNGDIYVTMYGQQKDDNTLCPYFQKYGEYDFYLYRTWAIVSHDRGKTFEYVGTIADCQTYPIADINAEGYCETDIIEAENGHLVSILRTGGHEIASPLYCAHSYDFGKTWDAPYPICDWGVLPRLLKLSDSTLVIASGHIHTMLLFSTDNGKTWSKPFIVEECSGKWGQSASGYTTILECEPGVLSLVYDDPKEGIAEGGEEGHVRKIYAVTLRLDKEE